MKTQRINDKWYIGRLPGAAFFGMSPGELAMKANEYLAGREVVSAPVERKRPELKVVGGTQS